MSGPLGSAQWMYASGAEVIQQSLKFNDDESQYLSWTPAAAGNRKTWTWSGWVKRGNLGSYQGLFGAGTTSPAYAALRFMDTDKIQFFVGGAVTYNISTTAVYRDVSAWYHICFAFDVTETTASDRCKLYVNGVQQTLSGTFPTNSNWEINNTYAHSVGAQSLNSTFSLHIDGYLSDINFIDGQALDASSFGQFTDGYWEKKDYAGTYGTNGFHLTFQDDVVSEGFNVATYRANAGTQSISGLGFSPDFVWTKARNNSFHHELYDTVRGSTKKLASSQTNAESTKADSLTSFDADGFTLGYQENSNYVAGNGGVAWCWDAGSGSPVSNTDGTITSTVKANPDYGFSIVSYTGTGANATVGHGLSSAPDLIIAKCRTAVDDWPVYHTSTGSSQYAYLDHTQAFSTATSVWQGVTPDSSVFSVGTSATANRSGASQIAYCFHSVAGYSSFGSYTGNGSASGPTVTTGFPVAFVMVKRTDSTGNWVMYDNTRATSNPINKLLYANLSSAEATWGSGGVDFNATGFQVKNSGGDMNVNGGTYIYMAFADTREAAFWKDVSGQGNHWTPNNLDYRDSLVDSPANNFCTLNPLDKLNSPTLSEGNLKYYPNVNGVARSTLGFNSGKLYFEIYQASTVSPSTPFGYGLCELEGPVTHTAFKQGLLVYGDNGAGHSVLTYVNGSLVQNDTGYFSTTAVGDVWQFAYDADTGKVWVGRNGTWFNSGDPAAGTGYIYQFSGDYTIGPVMDHAGANYTAILNTGQDSTFAGATTAGGNTDGNGKGDFKHPVPNGFLALCSANLPTTTIIDGSEHFNTVLYSGDGATSKAITGVGFQPDFNWVKQRNIAQSHTLTDAVRGVGFILSSNATSAEYSLTTYGQVTSFDTDGFTVSKGSNATYSYYNQSGGTYAAWNWKAGGTAVSNTDGSITSQVSANVDAGFSIVSYSGTGANATVGHGLNTEPQMIIAKARANGSSYWLTYHSGVASPSTSYLSLNTTSAVDTGGASVWNSTAPTSSVFSVGTSTWINPSGGDMIAYCFANSDTTKVGSYTGNGSTDGPFVYTGFRPAWIMWKRTDSSSGGEWVIQDTTRREFNPVNVSLYPNLSNAEATGETFRVQDTLSNGFKLRSSAAQCNASGGTYIYLAFAEHPFKYANAR